MYAGAEPAKVVILRKLVVVVLKRVGPCSEYIKGGKARCIHDVGIFAYVKKLAVPGGMLSSFGLDTDVARFHGGLAA